jgi:hypothetical protein
MDLLSQATRLASLASRKRARAALPLWLSGRASVLYCLVSPDTPIAGVLWGVWPVNHTLMETEGPGFDSQERHFAFLAYF